MSKYSVTLLSLISMLIAAEQPGFAQKQKHTNNHPKPAAVHESNSRDRLTYEDCHWAWEQLEIEQAQEIIYAAKKELPGDGISIAHIDTGIIPFLALQRNSDSGLYLAGLLWGPKINSFMGIMNFVQPHLPAIDNNPKAANFGHGTETASLIVGSLPETNVPGWGFKGVAPWARLLPIKVTDSVVMVGNISTGGTADLRNLAEGIRLATKLGAQVMTISLGAVFDQKNFIKTAVNEALEQGIIVVAAAGQTLPIDFVPLPANLPGVISVTASTRPLGHWQEAFSGKNISWAAPGEDVCHFGIDRNARNPPRLSQLQQVSQILSRDGAEMTLQGIVRRSSGTSYSTAFSAGAAALWLQHHNSSALAKLYGKKNISKLFMAVAREMAMETPPGWNTDKHGAGIINIRKLLEAPLPCRSVDTSENCAVKLSAFLSSASR